jgi:predicted transcriptional regulator
MSDTTTITITIVIDAGIDSELERIASATGQSKPDIAADVLAEWLQDHEDAGKAAAILARNEPTSSSAEVRRRLGLER